MSNPIISLTPAHEIFNGTPYNGFILESTGEGEPLSREQLAVYHYANYHKIDKITCEFSDIEIVAKFHPSYIPVGGVKFVEAFLKNHPVPDYHPIWTKSMVGRKTWTYIGKPHSEMFDNKGAVFVKPAYQTKQFDARVITQYDPVELDKLGKLSKSFYISEMVSGGFCEEFRYYVINGEVTDGYCYKTALIKDYDTSLVITPKFVELFPFVEIPANYTGTLDIGKLAKDQSKYLLIEAHEPYSIGWYGDIGADKSESYIKFLIDGWSKLTNKYKLRFV